MFQQVEIYFIDSGRIKNTIINIKNNNIFDRRISKIIKSYSHLLISKNKKENTFRKDSL